MHSKPTIFSYTGTHKCLHTNFLFEFLVQYYSVWIINSYWIFTAGKKIFRDFLKCEYSEENILFWMAVEELKKESNPDVIEEKARFIYEDYISILSPKEVSVTSFIYLFNWHKKFCCDEFRYGPIRYRTNRFFVVKLLNKNITNCCDGRPSCMGSSRGGGGFMGFNPLPH